MKAIRIIGLLVLIALAFGGGYVYKAVKGGAPSAGKNERKVLYWVDPMHPAYKSDKPGIAPDCGMKLEPGSAAGGAAAAPAAASRKVLYYRDPKDPNYKAQQPGLNPETGSELEPVYADDVSTMEVGTVQITPEKQQLIVPNLLFIHRADLCSTPSSCDARTFSFHHTDYFLQGHHARVTRCSHCQGAVRGAAFDRPLRIL